ncbi:MAG TPA: hypothetical protein VGL93_30640 [Streptosporangiaceae bacterium]|jgi:quercetin dioxygenase-like cupin family protein
MADAHAETQVDNDDVRVTRWSFAPGAHTGEHLHEYDYVVVPMTDSTQHVTNADGGTLVNEIRRGVCYQRPAGARHDVANGGDTEMVFVEIEYKHTTRA